MEGVKTRRQSIGAGVRQRNCTSISTSTTRPGSFQRGLSELRTCRTSEQREARPASGRESRDSREKKSGKRPGGRESEQVGPRNHSFSESMAKNPEERVPGRNMAPTAEEQNRQILFFRPIPLCKSRRHPRQNAGPREGTGRTNRGHRGSGCAPGPGGGYITGG